MTNTKQRNRVSNDEDDITNSDKSFSDTDENKNLDVDDVNIDKFTDSSELLEKTYERSYSKRYEMKSNNIIYWNSENDHDDKRRSKVSSSDRNCGKKNKTFVLIDKVKITKFLIALILSAIVVYVFYPKKINKESYEKMFHDLKVSFTLEDQLSWKALNNSLSKQLFKNTELLERPSVIILVGTKEKLESFLTRLENLISVSSPCRSWQPLKVDSTTLLYEQQDQLKSIMLNFLYETHKDGVHCAKMGDIDQIPPALGPILQGLTDEINAPYKHMIYLFSLVVGGGHRNDDDDGQSLNMRKLDEKFVVDVLRGFWVSEMGEERFQALITRVAGTVIGIK